MCDMTDRAPIHNKYIELFNVAHNTDIPYYLDSAGGYNCNGYMNYKVHSVDTYLDDISWFQLIKSGILI